MKPKLRLSGFTDTWKEIPINELLTFNNGINAPKESYGHGRKFINVLDILNNNYVLYENIIGSVSVDPKQEETSKVEYGDVLFLRSSETREDVGKSTTYLDENEFALFGGFVIRGKKIGNYNPYFLKLLLDTSSARNQISSKAGGSTRYNVSQSILNTVELFMPDIYEQEKIGSLFILLDRKILKQQEKIEKLDKLKKDMMQKIFTQEIRFKDGTGEEFPDWEERKLGDLGQFSRGGNLSKSNLSVNGNPCLLYGELYTLYGHVINKVYSRTEHNDKAVTGMKNDVLIPSSGETAIDIACASALEVDNVLLGGDINIFRPNKNVSGPFMSYQINSVKKNDLAVYAQGSSVVHLYNKEIQKVKVFLPIFAEQEKIAEFLLEIDRKIEKEAEKIPSLEEQKKGFMQRMFI